MSSHQVKANIQDKEYIIACKEDEKAILLKSVEYLNHKISNIKNSGNIIGNERILVLTALDIATELLETKDSSSKLSFEVDSTLKRLSEKVNFAMSTLETD